MVRPPSRWLRHGAIAIGPFLAQRTLAWDSLSFRLWEGGDSWEGGVLGHRRTDCRVIEMRASASFRDSRRVKAPASRVSGFAICAVRCDGLRSWPPAATITLWGNLRGIQHLRPKTRLVVAGSVRQNEGKALLRLEIRQIRKKCGDSAPSPPPLH